MHTVVVLFYCCGCTCFLIVHANVPAGRLNASNGKLLAPCGLKTDGLGSKCKLSGQQSTKHMEDFSVVACAGERQAAFAAYLRALREV